MRLAIVIRCYRKHRDLSLRECARQIGIGAATLMRFEQGMAMDAKTFLLILKWLTDSEAIEHDQHDLRYGRTARR